MQKAQVGPHFFVPADQHTPEAIHPTMGALHHPPPCFETGLLLERLGFFPPRPDVGGEAKLVQEFPYLVLGACPRINL